MLLSSKVHLFQSRKSTAVGSYFLHLIWLRLKFTASSTLSMYRKISERGDSKSKGAIWLSAQKGRNDVEREFIESADANSHVISNQEWPNSGS
jgi:hypothetical protein